MTGTFIGAGVGPGDPELITVKAVRAIERCSVIAVPVSDPALGEPVYLECSREVTKREEGYLNGCAAYRIAEKAASKIREKGILFLPMPMIKDREKLKEIHDADAEAVAKIMENGKDVIFLTIGDPTVYSTCMYVHKRLKRAGYSTELIPGVTSFCAAAARMDMALAENREEIHILPASYGVGDSLELPGTKVLMKAGKKMPEVQREVKKRNQSAYMVENCGLENEKIYLSVEEMPESAGYYSLLVVKEEKKGGRR